MCEACMTFGLSLCAKLYQGRRYGTLPDGADGGLDVRILVNKSSIPHVRREFLLASSDLRASALRVTHDAYDVIQHVCLISSRIAIFMG